MNQQDYHKKSFTRPPYGLCTLLAFVFAMLAGLVCFVPFSSAINASGSVYQVGMFGNGLQGGVGSGSTYSIRIHSSTALGTRNAYGSSYSGNIGFFPANAVPVIDSNAIYFYAVPNGTAVQFFASASFYANLWAEITYPNGTSINFTLANGVNNSFTDTGSLGRYNVSFIANNSAGSRNEIIDYFESLPLLYFGANATNAAGTGIASSLGIYYRGQQIGFQQSPTGSFNESVVDAPATGSGAGLLFKSYSDRLQVTLRGVGGVAGLAAENNKQVVFDHPTVNGYATTYLMNSSYAYSNATARIFYDDAAYSNEALLKLLKCDSYDFANHACLGNWLDLTAVSTQNNASHYFETTVSSFQAFTVSQATYCGDAVCNGGETCSSCPTDCGACSNGGNGGNGGGGGGGGITTIVVTPTPVPSIPAASIGKPSISSLVTMELSETPKNASIVSNNVIRFIYNDQSYDFQVDSVSPSFLAISNFYDRNVRFNLAAGEELFLDLDGDGVRDLRFHLMGEKDGKYVIEASLLVIATPTPTPTPMPTATPSPTVTSAPTSIPTATPLLPVQAGGIDRLVYFAFAMIIVLLLAIILLLLRKKRRPKAEPSKEVRKLLLEQETAKAAAASKERTRKLLLESKTKDNGIRRRLLGPRRK